MAEQTKRNTKKARQQEKEEKESQKRAKRSKKQGLGSNSRASNGLGKFIATVAIGLIGFALLTGLINQRRTGESIIQYYMNTVYKVSHMLDGVFYSKDKDSALDKVGLHQTKDGIYLKGHDGSNGESIENPGATDGAPDVANGTPGEDGAPVIN